MKTVATKAASGSKAPVDGGDTKTAEKTEKQIDEALNSTFPASDPVSAHSEVEAPENPGMNDPAKPAVTKVPQPPCCAEPQPRSHDTPVGSS